MADDVDVPDLGECGIQELELSPTRGRVCGSFNEVDRRNGQHTVTLPQVQHTGAPEHGVGSVGPTLAEIGAAIGAQIAAPPHDPTVAVHSVMDAERASDAASLDGALVVLDWAPHRPNGPLPNLLTTLDPLLTKRPTAVVITPSRPVNPPRPVLAHARRHGVGLLWVIEAAPVDDVRAQIDKLIQMAHTTRADRKGVTVPADLLGAADDLSRLLDELGGALDATVRLLDRPTNAAGTAGFPVVSGGRSAWLEIRRDSALTQEETELVELLIPVMRLHLRLRDTEHDETTAEAARNLKTILGEDLVAREATLRRSRRLSMFPRHPLVCLVIEPFGVAVTMAGIQQLRSDLEPLARRTDRDAITIVHEGAVVMMVNAAVGLDIMSRGLYRAVRTPLVIGASDEVTAPRSYPGAFRQAQRAVAVGRRVGGVNRVTRYRDLGILGLLYQLPEHARRGFVTETLGSVADDTPDALDQRRILRTLRATDCNITESARKLFIHPNTLRARINRIESITGQFLNDPAKRMNIFTALAMFSLDSNPEGE